MPPLILIIAGLVGGAALVRLAKRETSRINRELDEARESRLGNRVGIPKLKRDPDTGTFRPPS